MPTGIYLRKPMSIESREKIRLSKIGNKNPMFGKHISNETREKKRIASIGRRHSLKTRIKLSEIFSGKNSHFWKGGIAKLNKHLHRLFESKVWRILVFERDSYTCQCCNNVGGRLHAHHIKARSRILIENNIKTIEEAKKCKELWDLNNGVTLCIDCHKLTPNYGVNV